MLYVLKTRIIREILSNLFFCLWTWDDNYYDLRCKTVLNDQIMQEEKKRCTTCACWYSLLFIVIWENIYSRMKLVAEERLRKRRPLFPHFKSLLLCYWLKCVTSKTLSRGNKKNQMPNRTIIISSHFCPFYYWCLKASWCH